MPISPSPWSFFKTASLNSAAKVRPFHLTNDDADDIARFVDENDVRLASAAPDMKVALENLIADIERILGRPIPDDHEAKAALAKATGASQPDKPAQPADAPAFGFVPVAVVEKTTQGSYHVNHHLRWQQDCDEGDVLYKAIGNVPVKSHAELTLGLQSIANMHVDENTDFRQLAAICMFVARSTLAKSGSKP
jgi:hypothetical protein